MAFTSDEVSSISAGTLKNYIDKGKVWTQFVKNKPMLDAFNRLAGKFSGGGGPNQILSVGVKAGGSANRLQGYTHDDQVSYATYAGLERAEYSWKEHHIGMKVSHTELKIDGIDIADDGDLEHVRPMEGREAHALANLLDEKLDDIGEDFAYSMDLLVHGDGSTAAKAIAGIGALLLADPTDGITGGLDRSTHAYWRNDAMTVEAGLAGGLGPITSNTANGGALIEAMDVAARRRSTYANGATNIKYFCGSAFLDAYRKELRANGSYTQSGWGNSKPDGSMKDPQHAGLDLTWDPTMDALGLSKRCYAIDMSRGGVRLMYMDGQRMKKHNPKRPVDRYVEYMGITTTCVMIAKQLNTSGVYDIA